MIINCLRFATPAEAYWRLFAVPPFFVVRKRKRREKREERREKREERERQNRAKKQENKTERRKKERKKVLGASSRRLGCPFAPGS